MRRHRCSLCSNRILAVLFIGLIPLTALSAGPELTTPVPALLQICGDDSSWRPYTYVAIEAGNDAARATGYSVEYIRTLLQRAGHRAEFTLLPWKRCVAMGSNGEYDIVLDVARTAEREQQFLFPRSHYTVSSVYLYSTEWPRPRLRNRDDLPRYRVCLQAGWAYEIGVPAALQSTFNVEAKSLEAAIRMVENGRCEVLLHTREIIDSYLTAGRLPALAAGRVRMEILALPQPVAMPMYAGVSPVLPYRHELVALLDRGIGEMERSGLIPALQAKYLLQDSDEP